MDCKDWELSCTVKVTASCPGSYFCVVGWGPGGYSGIQEVSRDRKVVIFSMWNNKKDGKVFLEERGPGADVAEFHGEGEGLRCLMPLEWNTGEKVTLVVRGQKKAGDWLCSAHFICR